MLPAASLAGEAAPHAEREPAADPALGEAGAAPRVVVSAEEWAAILAAFEMGLRRRKVCLTVFRTEGGKAYQKVQAVCNAYEREQHVRAQADRPAPYASTPAALSRRRCSIWAEAIHNPGYMHDVREPGCAMCEGRATVEVVAEHIAGFEQYVRFVSCEPQQNRQASICSAGNVRYGMTSSACAPGAGWVRWDAHVLSASPQIPPVESSLQRLITRRGFVNLSPFRVRMCDSGGIRVRNWLSAPYEATTWRLVTWFQTSNRRARSLRYLCALTRWRRG